MDVLKFGLVSDAVDPYTLRDIADWTLKPHLLALPGIARVTVYGGAVRQVQIQPDLDRLAGLGLTVADVMTAGREALALARRRHHRHAIAAHHPRRASARTRPAGHRPGAARHAGQQRR